MGKGRQFVSQVNGGKETVKSAKDGRLPTCVPFDRRQSSVRASSNQLEASNLSAHKGWSLLLFRTANHSAGLELSASLP